MISEKLKLIKDFFEKPNYVTDVVNNYPAIQTINNIHDLEQERVEEELNNIYSKLSKWEYLLKNFSSSNKFDISWRMMEFYVYLDSYYQIAYTRKQLLSKCNISKSTSIADLCPGRSPKIWLWLYYWWFRWTLSIIDQDIQALKMQERFIRLFNSEFKIIQENRIFWQDTLQEYWILAWNHIIDDLVVAEFWKEINDKGLIKRYYQNESQIIKIRKWILDLWSERQEKISKKYARSLFDATKPWWYIIITHYMSYVDDLLSHDICYNYCLNLLQQINQDLIWLWAQTMWNVEFTDKSKVLKKEEFILLQKHI